MSTENQTSRRLGGGQRHTTDLFFTLSLFFVFAAAAFLVIMIGIRVYQSTVTTMQDTYSTRTAISYVAEKLRRHDSVGSASVTTLEGGDALLLTDDINGNTYLTYIYQEDGYLCELVVKDGADISRSQGEQIIAVEDFSVSETEDGFFEISAASSDGGTLRFLLHPRSESF